MDLFSPYDLHGVPLRNRFVMAPLTRSRAIDGNVPNPLAVTYYAQRASAGLIISEGSQVSPLGVGYIRTPGIYSPAQVEGWRAITDAVHAAGSKMYLQLWHVGRVSHSDFHNGALPVAPSALPVDGVVHTPLGRRQIEIPRALETDEVPGIVEEFRTAAANAKAAGFDGVEIHGANGYLLDQFLRDGANHRNDKYGGSIENRARFPLEVTKAVIDVWGAHRVGYRVSPHLTAYSMSDSDPVALYSYLAEQFNALDLGYLHIVERIAGPMMIPEEERQFGPLLRGIFRNTFILNGAYDAESAGVAILNGETDLVAFGVPFLANPDLPTRFKLHAPLNEADRATFYAGEEKGYIDYPFLTTPK